MYVINFKVYILFDILIVKYNKVKICIWLIIYFEYL